MNTPLIKILLLGEYSIFRSALRMLLETDRKLRVIGEATHLSAAEPIMAEENPDLILVDLPEAEGCVNLGDFDHSATPVLVLIGDHDVEVYKSCLRLGISGLVPKGERMATLFKAIEKVNDGEIWFDRAIMGDTIRQLIEEKRKVHESPQAQAANALTQREKEVVELICTGLKNRDIADKLFITETTVRHHLTSVFNKLDITSRLELVIHAFKNNLVAPPTRNGSGNGNGKAGKILGTMLA